MLGTFKTRLTATKLPLGRIEPRHGRAHIAQLGESATRRAFDIEQRLHQRTIVTDHQPVLLALVLALRLPRVLLALTAGFGMPTFHLLPIRLRPSSQYGFSNPERHESPGFVTKTHPDRGIYPKGAR